MKLLGNDESGRRFYATAYTPGCLSSLPWGKRRFDCGILIHRRAHGATIESCVQEAVSENTDWVATYGSDAEQWHDRVDRASVGAGRQKKPGDGSPMTAWFGDIKTCDQFDISTCFGAGRVLLVLVGFPGPRRSHVEAIARHFRANFSAERVAAGGSRSHTWARGARRHRSPRR
jgi:hypothetical protein